MGAVFALLLASNGKMCPILMLFWDETPKHGPIRAVSLFFKISHFFRLVIILLS